MIDKDYYKNLPPKNILKEANDENISNNSFNNLTEAPLQNMIINSNLDNETIIK